MRFDLPPRKRSVQPGCDSSDGGDEQEGLEEAGRGEEGWQGGSDQREDGLIQDAWQEGNSHAVDGVVERGWHEGRDKRLDGLVEQGRREVSGRGGATVLQRGPGGEDGGLKTVAQQNLAVRRLRSHKPPYQFVGPFSNDSATVCYLNAAVNILFTSLQFNDIFFTIKSRGALINQLHLVCCSHPGKVRDLDTVRRLVAATAADSEFLNTAQHQDPGEFIKVLLRAIQEEMECEEGEGRLEAGTAARFGRLFTVGVLQHKWCNLGHSSYEQEDHPLLQLPVVDIVTKGPLDTLRKVIDAYFRKEEIKGSKCPDCTQQVFQRREPEGPEVLLLQYNRFDFDRVKKTAIKLDQSIQALESLIFGGGLYRLRGFLCHSGVSCHSGHYFAVVRCARSGDFFLANNDDPIEAIGKEDAAALATKAYILLYEKHTEDQQGLLDALLGDALHQLSMAERQVKCKLYYWSIKCKLWLAS